MEQSKDSELEKLVLLLETKNQKLLETENELLEQKEELQSQKEELTAAVEALVAKNNSMAEVLKQLQQRNVEMDKILYGTSHDLRTPVSSLIGLLNLLKMEMLSPNQLQIHEHMEQKVLQMSTILSSLSILSFAFFNQIVKTQVSLLSLTEKVMKELTLIPGFNEITFNIGYNNIEYITTDETGLHYILKCLLDNAISFSNSHGEKKVNLEFNKSEDWLTIKVNDNGMGISQDVGDRIFEMFFRGSELSQGSGLGLYIVKNLVDRMNGKISWNSDANGTVFQVVLPAS